MKDTMDTVLTDPKERRFHAYAEARAALMDLLDADAECPDSTGWAEVFTLLRVTAKRRNADVISAELDAERSAHTRASTQQRIADSLNPTPDDPYATQAAYLADRYSA